MITMCDYTLTFLLVALIVFAVVWIRYRVQLYQLRQDRKFLWADAYRERHSREE